MVLLLVGLRRRLGTIEGRALSASVGRTMAASLLAGVAGWGAAQVLVFPGLPSGFGRMVPGLGGMAAFTVVFFLAALGLRAPELEEIVRAFRRRLSRGAKRSGSPSV
jgi:peptidoglycan biosynthesis protein MviN/MurJ (putative lipid II flippase)